MRIRMIVALITAAGLVSGSAIAEESWSQLRPAGEQGYGYVFHDDPVMGGGFGPNDPVLRVFQHPRRLTLIRPRTHFVPELLKSVEHI